MGKWGERLTALAVLALLVVGCASSGGADGQEAGGQHAHGEHAAHAGAEAGAQPAQPGQAAFGAIQEIVRILEADPNTDWSKVQIGRLHEHLIDMDELTLRAAVAAREIPGGLEMVVTGQGRTLEAIRRMVPTHAQMTLSRIEGWSVEVEERADGVALRVVARSAEETARIRGLGFIGLMATGSDHTAHHLAVARGEMHLGH